METISAEIVADLRAKISPSLNTEAASLIGNFVGIFASKLGEVWELLEAVYRSTDRNSASGDPLDVIGGLIGVSREPAKKSQVFVTISVNAGFSQAPGTMIASVDGNPSARFVNKYLVESVGGGILLDVPFEAEITGPVEAPSNTLFVIANPITGWLTVNNPLDATIGAAVESDQAYRVRQIVELARVGSTTADAVRADVLEVEGVTSCTVLENDGDTVDGEGLSPHSIEAIVLGGTDENVAEAILRSKAGGIKAGGDDSLVVTDSQGKDHTIGYTRPAEVLIYFEITVFYDADTYAGDTAVKSAIVAYGQANQAVGVGVIKQRIAALVMGIAGVTDVDVSGIDNVTPTVTSTNYAIGTREIARFDSSRITITPG